MRCKQIIIKEKIFDLEISWIQFRYGMVLSCIQFGDEKERLRQTQERSTDS